LTTPHEKGNALEQAVASIETKILETSPALREGTFLIERKKIINCGDVHHEVDVFISAVAICAALTNSIVSGWSLFRGAIRMPTSKLTVSLAAPILEFIDIEA